MVTPFIKQLQPTGGTFYTFPSAAEDLANIVNSGAWKYKFTKYALLKMPKIATPAFLENYIQFGNIEGAFVTGLDPDNNINLANSFENYCLNLETMLVSREQYDRTQKKTVTEAVFFKWLKELGALRYQAANTLQSTTNQTTDPRFVEEPENTTSATQRYYRVVQYVGEIDLVNSIQNNTNAYAEVYIQVPTSDGNSPFVLFKSEFDSNYPLDFTLRNVQADPLNDEVLFGRKYTDTHPAGLSIQAFYDQDAAGTPSSLFWDGSAYTVVQRWYDPKTGPNAYFTDALAGDVTNDRIRHQISLQVYDMVRSRLDGVGIDFDATSYRPISDNAAISTIQEWNSTAQAADFEFNAVLVYYDVYDANDPTQFATNLYGVLFLENVEQVGTDFGIPTLTKHKPNPFTQTNGDGYGFKINLKFDTSADQAGIVEKSVNDYNTFSMELFQETMTILQKSVNIITSQQKEFDTIRQQVQDLESLVVNNTTAQQLQTQITALQDSMIANQALFTNSSNIMALFNNLQSQLTALTNGQTTVSISYNADVLQAGAGVQLDKSVPNQVKVTNSVQAYTVPQVYQGDVLLGNAVKLQPFTNYYRHYASGLSQQATGDVQIRIDDTLTKWQTGQMLRLSFEDVLDMQQYSVVLVTDAPGLSGLGPYGRVVAVLTGAQFDLASDRPIFDIVCINPATWTFIVDQIR